MRVLFTAAPLRGHFFPLVPLAWALRCAGHQVLVGCVADFTPTVLGTGLPAATLSERVGIEDYARFNGDGGTDLATGYLTSGAGWGRLAGQILDGTRALLGAYRPDVVISEPCEFAGRIAAAGAALPWMEHAWALAVPPDFAVAAATALGSLPEPDIRLYACPPTLLQRGSPPGLNMRYVPYNGDATTPDWLPPERDRPRVLVSFGSLLPRYGTDRLRTLLTGLAAELTGAGFELVMAMEDAVARGLGELPAGVRYAGWVPQNQVLPHCDLAVHHGGSGTSMAALVHGLPQVILPQATDQFVTAGQLAGAGAGIALAPGQGSPAAVREALRAVHSDPAYRARAGALAAELAALPGPAQIAQALAGLAGSARRPARISS